MKELESECNGHSKSMLCRHTVLQPGPIVILSYRQYPQSAHHCVHSTMYSVQCAMHDTTRHIVHPQSTATPGSMASIIAAEGASPSKHTSEQPVFMHQVQCHEKLCINKCFFVI